MAFFASAALSVDSSSEASNPRSASKLDACNVIESLTPFLSQLLGVALLIPREESAPLIMIRIAAQSSLAFVSDDKLIITAPV